MGADMVLATAPAPIYRDEPTAWQRTGWVDIEQVMERAARPQFIHRARSLLLDDDGHAYASVLGSDTHEEVRSTVEAMPLAPDVDHEVWVEVLPDAKVLQVVRASLEEVVYHGNREVTVLRVEPPLLVSGGLSWGDAPTDACEHLWFLGDLGLTDEPFDRTHTG